MKELINVYKYESVRVVGDVLAELILNTFDLDGVLVPLPTISKHVRERGFGHIEYLLHRLSKLSRQNRRSRKVHLACAKILKRVNATVQVGANAEKRKIQAQKAYEAIKNFDPSKRYILVDDVWATGSSMLAAAQKLRSLGAQHVDILVIAKTV